MTEDTVPIKWIKVENVKGLRYYEHSTRIYKKRKDRNFSLTYKLDGQTKTESLGWESDGWTIEKASAIMNELKQNQKTCHGPRTLAEKREQAQKQKEEEEAKTKEEESKTITFSQVYEMYMPAQKMKKDPKTCKNEVGYYENWFKETIGEKPIDIITIDELQAIIDKAISSGKKPATARLLKAFVRQVLNFAKDRELYTKDNVAEKISIPKFDNRRTRFLSVEEAQKLLSILKERNKQAHDMSIFSMYSGARQGEVFSLCWENINFKTKFIALFDTKNNNKTRHVPLTEETEKLLKNLHTKDSRGPVFKTESGERFKNLPRAFLYAIDELGLNNGIKDARQKVVFHTLRHSYASWLMMKGADLLAVKELLGHSTTAMTERYSHLSPEHLKKTAALLNSL
ncbi:MAG: site-specific integrase [Holosporaceae bacterium]|jgi:integrase|nr:site-specific integrase [Holosporaceae bacterium]